MRLAYCSSEEQRRWLLAQETELFKHRAENETASAIKSFMERYSQHFDVATQEEKTAYRERLRLAWESQPQQAEIEGDAPPVFDPTEDYYKVPFKNVIDLVRRRHVLLVRGIAFVPRARMVSALVGRFRAYLSASLVAANAHLPRVLADPRLKPMIENMSKTYTGPEFGAAGRGAVDAVTADAVDDLSRSAFPLCMASMHSGLKERHRLKHLGRLQYGLFLKGIGLPLEEALVFWQREFTQGMSGEDFLKKYAYNIRYNYGKEGKRTDFTAYSCVKIILAPPPGPDEVHGCPFKTWDTARMRAALGKMQLAPTDADDVIKHMVNKDFQIACRRQFEARFKGADAANVGNHPNSYFVRVWARRGPWRRGDGGGGGAPPRHYVWGILFVVGNLVHKLICLIASHLFVQLPFLRMSSALPFHCVGGSANICERRRQARSRLAAAACWRRTAAVGRARSGSCNSSACRYFLGKWARQISALLGALYVSQTVNAPLRPVSSTLSHSLSNDFKGILSKLAAACSRV